MGLWGKKPRAFGGVGPKLCEARGHTSGCQGRGDGRGIEGLLHFGRALKAPKVTNPWLIIGVLGGPTVFPRISTSF